MHVYSFIENFKRSDFAHEINKGTSLAQILRKMIFKSPFANVFLFGLLSCTCSHNITETFVNLLYIL